ncbi:hypothetical protein FLJC2902T_15010 [Flavobacterium limnosediminis JC2902]|uniref:Uncharacterized protein n=1 Tax=Flavobacterium limnosediminis JC2902 TaxID=1341181 RepID=V6SR20_9FLAO|nr:toxin-antitoxin system YwqK family antitoxin [Flavobacterium limnosediminis]ESU28904.1 hypothetical protein FLJC2902T_15010 [Flavobacterium limnosediminis JC2902]
MRKLIIALLLGSSSGVYSQSAYSHKDYSFVYQNDSIIKKGISLYESQKYDESIKEFDKIEKTDPRFLDAQYEKALSLYAMKKNEEFEKLMNDLQQKNQFEKSPNLYTLYGNYLSDAKRYDEAEKIFLEGEKLLGNSSNFLYNFAILYIRKEESQKSIELLKKVIVKNPNHASAHYFLGFLALENGNITEGTLALLSYITLAPDGKYAKEAVLKLNKKFGENYLEKGKLVFSKSGDNFEEIDVILRNQLPLKKAYKVKSDFDDIVIRQVQAVVEYTKEHKSGDGFFESTYLPWIKDIAEKNYFEGLSYYILLSLEDDLGKKLTSHKKEIQGFQQKYIETDFWRMFATRKTEHFGETKEVLVYLKDNVPYVVGTYVDGKKEGKFKLLDEYGNVSGELNFKNDLSEGVQKYFNSKGQLIEERTYINNKLEGKKTEYFENGNISTIENYKDDKLEGVSSTYHINGGKYCELNFNDGKENGILTCYYPNGKVKSSISYKEGKVDGQYIKYNEVGDIEEEGTYANGELNGKYTTYFSKKDIKSEITYVNGKANGVSKKYFNNGSIEEENTYENGDLLKTTEYYPTGKKSKEGIYTDKGESEVYSYFDENENKYFEGKYRKNELKSVFQFTKNNPKPTPININKKPVQFRNFNGEVIITGEFEKGFKNKTWEQKFSNGVVKFKETYNKGTQEGVTYNYNRDGSLNSITNYADNKINGLYESYEYGIQDEMIYFENGEKSGPYKTFFADGTTETEGFYDNDELNCDKSEYWLSGKLKSKTTFKDGEITSFKRFDTNGEPNSTLDYKNRSGNLTVSLFNGTVTENYDMVNGYFNGKYIEKDKDNNLIAEGEFVNGMRHNYMKFYGPAGKLSYERPYYSGVLHGLNKQYDLAGNLRIADEYVYGDEYGKTTRYYHNKSKVYEYTQLNNLMEGDYTYYNQKGEDILIVGYQNNAPKYYIKKGKDGQLNDKHEITGESAEITSHYPNGKLAITLTLDKGALNGKFIINNTEGKPEITTTYKKNFSEGERYEYYANGNIYKVERLKSGDFEGLQEYFAENGNRILTANYKDNNLHGDVVLYKDNKPVVTKKYDTNELVQIIK